MEQCNGKRVSNPSNHKKESVLTGHHHSLPSSNDLTLKTSCGFQAHSGEPLATVVEEDAKDEFGSLISAATLATLTSRHLMATSDARSMAYKTQDLTTYKKSLCQQWKTSSKVPSPYHAVSQLAIQGKVPSKTSEAGTEDTGYKSELSSVAGSYELHQRHKRCQETHASRHRDRTGHHVRVPPIQHPLDVQSLAAELIAKLQCVLKDQNAKENIYRSREDLADVDAQSILDDHVTRIWGDSSGELSPREKVSSWVMKHSMDCTEEHVPLSERCLPPEDALGDVKRRLSKLNVGHRLGSIDEGLGQSMNSLANSRLELGRCSANAHESAETLPRSFSSECEKQPSGCFLSKANKKVSSSSRPNSSAAATNKDFVSVIYQITGESLPYLSKVYEREISLKQFKSLVPRKGKYRYFFKRLCEDVDVGVVFEEITDDNEVLPLWEGKISARLESVD